MGLQVQVQVQTQVKGPDSDSKQVSLALELVLRMVAGILAVELVAMYPLTPMHVPAEVGVKVTTRMGMEVEVGMAMEVGSLILPMAAEATRSWASHSQAE